MGTCQDEDEVKEVATHDSNGDGGDNHRDLHDGDETTPGSGNDDHVDVGAHNGVHSPGDQGGATFVDLPVTTGQHLRVEAITQATHHAVGSAHTVRAPPWWQVRH